MKCGLYAIVNRVNGKKYIGTSVNLRSRKAGHWYKLRNNKHSNLHLQAAWNKYGEEAFEFVILTYLEESELKSTEERAIQVYGTYDRTKGYNIETEITRKRHTEETKERMRQSAKGFTPESRERAQETKRRIVAANGGKCPWGMTGKHHTEETKARLRQSSIANKSGGFTEESRRKSMETRSQRAKEMGGCYWGMTGRKASEETKRKISEAHKGKRASPEARNNMRQAALAYWAKRRAQKETSGE